MLNMKIETYIRGTNIDVVPGSSWHSFLPFSWPQSCKKLKCSNPISCFYRILCWIQTGNLLRGETTGERFSSTSYKSLHKFHAENMSSEMSMELFLKKRFSVMSIDDNTNKSNKLCGNITGMCCNQTIMKQDEILQKTYDAYGQRISELSRINLG